MRSRISARANSASSCASPTSFATGSPLTPGLFPCFFIQLLTGHAQLDGQGDQALLGAVFSST